MDSLQSIEATIILTYRGEPEMTDADAMKAYDALIHYYRGVMWEQEVSIPNLEGFPLQVFHDVREILDTRESHTSEEKEKNPTRTRFSRRAFGGSKKKEAKYIKALRKLKNSLTLCTKEKRIRGYLDYINRFL